ncbi:MAG: hypothetical protein V4658_11090 [Bacteroidota bacterium]
MVQATLLFTYGLFLICCGIASVIFIGMKAKTALVSGGMAGIISMAIGHFISTQSSGAVLAGMIWPMILFCVFAWRSTKTLHKIFELIPSQNEDLKGKGIAFLVISLMAVVSIMVFFIQVAFSAA